MSEPTQTCPLCGGTGNTHYPLSHDDLIALSENVSEQVEEAWEDDQEPILTDQQLRDLDVFGDPIQNEIDQLEVQTTETGPPNDGILDEIDRMDAETMADEAEKYELLIEESRRNDVP